MKTFYSFLAVALLIIGLNNASSAQTFSDDFTGLTAATNLAGQSGWTKGGSGPDATVDNATPLTYTGYSSNGGEYVAMPTPIATSSRVYKTFTTPVTSYTNSTFFYSFLLRITSAANNTGKNYFMSLGASGTATNYGAKLFTSANGTGFSLGLSKTTNTAVYDSATVLEFNTTYLIVVRYTFNTAGTTAPANLDDVAYLWINPSGSTEPLITAANCTTSATDTDFDGFAPAPVDVGNFVWHNRGLGNPVGAFDGVKVGHGATSADAWTDLNPGPLPVELTSFSAVSVKEGVQLKWNTATEKNNSGFDIERKSVNTEFAKIGFVKGSGTTTNSSSYNFTDKSVNANASYSYRLKQVDYDGTFAYSDIVNVSGAQTPTTFELTQNFPNPFNPTTSISYSLATSGVVTLAIFNTLGEKVKEVVNGFHEAGNYTVALNASDLSSGNYIYKISLNGQSISKKMIVLK